MLDRESGEVRVGHCVRSRAGSAAEVREYLPVTRAGAEPYRRRRGENNRAELERSIYRRGFQVHAAIRDDADERAQHELTHAERLRPTELVFEPRANL